jgi:hypothetical protein
MTIHQSNPNKRPDEDFLPGELAFLVPGNRCRLLDGRRTPGVIETCDLDSAMFRWRITAFEDEGKSWHLPAEDVRNYQFEPDSARLRPEQVEALQAQIERYQTPLLIPADEAARAATVQTLEPLEQSARGWLRSRSRFFEGDAAIDWDSRRGPSALGEDLLCYLAEHDLDSVETRTAENIVLNPASGEWVKGMLIVLAEMGLVDFKGTIPRTEDIFRGEGAKPLRREYLIHRLAFLRAAFHLLSIDDVVLYRGMSTERAWTEKTRSLLSCTFSLEVAQAFAHFDRDDHYRHAYLVKTTLPVERLWMTYLETLAMNRQYLEAEALVFNRGDLKLYW